MIPLTNIKQTTELCRYCLMCRHLCPVTHVTNSEATSPHGWGTLVASVERDVTDWNEDNVNVLYKCADCGLCQAHCVTDQPLPLAISAARFDVVARQKSLPVVYDIQQKLQQWSNPYRETTPETVTGRGQSALIVGAVGQYLQPETVEAATKLLAAASVEAVPIALGRETPQLATTLGLPDEARALAHATLAEIEAVGAQRVFVLSPGEVYTYQTVLEYLGLSWPEGVELVEVTTFLADQLETDNLSFKPTELSDFTFYDPDQTTRVPGRWEAPRRLLAAISQTAPTELFWRQERAAACGVSGGLPFTQPQLSAQLAQTRLAEAAERGVKTLITDDPHALHHLKNQTNSGNTVAVRGLFELLAAQL